MKLQKKAEKNDKTLNIPPEKVVNKNKRTHIFAGRILSLTKADVEMPNNDISS